MEPNTLEITEQPEGLRFASIRDLVNRTLNQNFGTKTTPEGVSTGFKELDLTLGGFQKGQVYTIAVKPGMGKTAFLLSLANNMAIKENYTVAIFSSERSNIKMTNRLIESETGMSLDKLQSGALKDSEKDHIFSLLNRIAKAKIYIDDTPALSLEDFSEKIRKFRGLYHVDLVIIDYLELLTTGIPEPEERPEQLGRIVENIRSIARELDLPVLLFSQSAGYTNGYSAPGRPPLNALPGFLQDHSDVLMLLHRNDVYTINKTDRSRHAVELVVGKKDAADTELVIPLSFIESIAKFTDFS